MAKTNTAEITANLPGHTRQHRVGEDAMHLDGHSGHERTPLVEALVGATAAPIEQPQDLNAAWDQELKSLAEKALQRDQALRHIAQTVAANFTNAKYFYDLAEAMRRQYDHGQAQRLYRRAIAIDPAHVPSHLGMARSLHAAGETQAAEQQLELALEVEPQRVDALLLWATMLRADARPEAAETKLRRALEIDPKHPTAMLRLAEVEREKGNIQTALSLMDQALAGDNCDADARCARGMLALQQGEWSYGWQEYEWRWRRSAQEDVSRPKCPLWDGSSLARKSILVRGEDKLADDLMFSSCLRDLSEHADQCVLEIDRRLVSLFQRTFDGIECVPRGALSPEEMDRFDAWTPLASLPRHLRTSSARFPDQANYLQPNDSWRSLHVRNLHDLGPGLKIGISWRSMSAEPQNAPARETTLADWKPILNVEGVHLLNLQGPESEEEFRAALDLHPRAEMRHWEFVNPRGDMDDLASLVAALDLVITVPNRLAHLAGALGVPCWNVLSDWPSWRWGISGDRSPWYPSMTLFRASRPGAWEDAFVPMGKELLRMSRRKSNWTR